MKNKYRNPPNDMIKNGKAGGKFYKVVGSSFVLKTKQEFEEAENKKLEEPKTYRKIAKLEDMINYYSHSRFREQGILFLRIFNSFPLFNIEDKIQEVKNFDIFLDFLKDLLNLDPKKRVSACKAITHPFITNFEKLNEKIDVKLPYFENEEKGICEFFNRD